MNAAMQTDIITFYGVGTTWSEAIQNTEEQMAVFFTPDIEWLATTTTSQVTHDRFYFALTITYREPSRDEGAA